ncbi:MAG: hypothetical protein PHI06_13460 [Desulfobulbaceae bacterium]|nr:hypothetical protein [Desulfobulbaceae bacterium]
MNSKRVDALARIRWYSNAEGGRMTLPSGQMYGTNIRFENDANLWSVVILLQESSPDDKGIQEVKLGFLFRENIKQHLVAGRRFFICEGPEKIIAEGEIISVTT